MPKLKKFLEEIKIEMQKVIWPTRKELTESTWIVIINVIFFAILIGIIDKLLFGILNWIM